MRVDSTLKVGKSLRWVLFGALIFAADLYAQGNAPASAGFQPSFVVPANASEIVIEYNLVHQMLAEPDSEPLMRVYGDGKVKMHIPDYMKDQGDYEIQLSRPELIALVRSLVENDIVEFDRAANRQHKQTLEDEKRQASGLLYHMSDTTETLIDIKLNNYRRGSSSPQVAKLNKQFTWGNLSHDAKRYPQWNAIQKAAASEQELRTLLNRSDRRKIK